MGRKNAPAALSTHDAAVWHTIDINQRLERGGLAERPPIPTMFRPHLGPGERVLADGGVVLREFCSAGDGSYHHDSSFFFASGAGGLALTGAFAAARAVGNSRRKAAAASAAAQQWRPIASGRIFVSTHGFYLQEPTGMHPWVLSAITGMEVVAPGVSMLSGNSDRGAICWLVESEWAELVFTLWAHQLYPQHPQLTSFAWIPPGWQQRVTQAGMALPSYGRSELPS
ncbi:hypothetical protein FB554_2902 [Barrientosiimonas humi]|uniref:Uncharacterized protein n=1 Tax=Barrientosiimonas humi TaxID=999931 RepID=A0A542XFX1_9MICO|nr:hypothetical protein [Barrientosiimonas humi]TQL34724.1 hypothetical protein FB554_2902 [Barrientosiimonas humi]